MKLKLTHSEFTAMLQMFICIVLPQPAGNIEQILFKSLLMQIYEKLYKHAIHSKDRYAIKLTEAETIAFYAFWQKHQFSNPVSFEANLVRQIINSINQKFAI